MRIFVVLICSLVLACVALGAEQGKKKEQKKGAPAGQVSQPHGQPVGKPTTSGKPMRTQHLNDENVTGLKGVGQSTGAGRPTGKPATNAVAGKPAGKHVEATNKVFTQINGGGVQPAGKAKGKKGQASMEAYGGQTSKKGQTSMGQKGKKGQTSAGAYEGQPGKPAKGGTEKFLVKPSSSGTLAKTIKPQHFKLPKEPNIAKAPAVTFQQGRHIEGSQNWQGQHYTVFRNYSSEWHDQSYLRL